MKTWPPELLPPFSPDLNRLDYSICSVLETRVGAYAHASLAALRASVSMEWAALDEYYVRNACQPFRRRREQTIAADSG